MRTPLAGLLALVLAGGCAAAEPLSDIDSARDWANRSSAVGVWSRVHDIVAAGAGRDPFRDPECPVVVIGDATTTVTGGCVANDGQTWEGTATITRDGENQDIVIEGFGHAEDAGLMTKIDGTVTIRPAFDGSHSFVIALESDTPFQGLTVIAYEGTVIGDYTSPTTWNGSGTFDHDGHRVSATTVREVWDETQCRGAPASGTTTMTTDLHTVEIVYDGATDCDEDKNAQWRQDGVDMGAIDGITCAASPGRTGPMWLGLGLGALALWRATRRRAQRHA